MSRINELRARAGLTVAALAKRAGMQRSHLSRIINDDDPNMQLVVFSSLIAALGAENEMQIVARFHNAQAVPLALAVGAESRGAAPGRRLHVVSPDAPTANDGGRQSTAGGPAQPRADRTTQQIEQERARASRAEAEAARAKQRADEAEARAREDYALDEWTSPGELLAEDGAMGVAPLRGGGFVTVGWGRNKGTIRQVLTRWFSAAGDAGPVRVEPTPGSDAIGYAIGEDREGKIIIAGSRKQPAPDMDAWIFAIPGPLGAHVWDVIRDGPGHGPDEAPGLAMGPWGHVSIAGSEFAELQPQAFALRLYP
ncbi:helix-turn-helix transcriptional regulator [Nannocystis sp. SCPEA4]|uniref:helix-turn-helix domain-containing protein n=1 Tax=Nannocystis sp. SCPEA4 TaxID=2996787 RepID=UPI002271FC64|nr:helix-turn-helix transcriptional regulator [Nannocystis sp. SCPEA4]